MAARHNPLTPLKDAACAAPTRLPRLDPREICEELSSCVVCSGRVACTPNGDGYDLRTFDSPRPVFAVASLGRLGLGCGRFGCQGAVHFSALQSLQSQPIGRCCHYSHAGRWKPRRRRTFPALVGRFAYPSCCCWSVRARPGIRLSDDPRFRVKQPEQLDFRSPDQLR